MMKQIEIGKSPVEFFDSVSDRDYAFFLDSGMSHDRLGRYSFIGYEPFMVFRSKGRAVEVIRDGKTEDIEANPFDVLEGLLKD
ncbi:MAG: aminodeoxychorismate synthase, component I, partial [Candidatus Altiarchaeota archaeon]|nr:aminodeoxychorismate synthase, component I [Candidatus Altiarchaeota archaeon]